MPAKRDLYALCPAYQMRPSFPTYTSAATGSRNDQAAGQRIYKQPRVRLGLARRLLLSRSVVLWHRERSLNNLAKDRHILRQNIVSIIRRGVRMMTL